MTLKKSITAAALAVFVAGPALAQSPVKIGMVTTL